MECWAWVPVETFVGEQIRSRAPCGGHMIEKLKQYGIWNTDEEDAHYWELYDSIQDAVASQSTSEAVEVYELTAEPLGLYKLSTVKAVKVKTRKKKAS